MIGANRPRRRRGKPLHLLEAVIGWPLETFLQSKLEGLAARGFRVTVASTVPRRKAKPRLRGIELIRVPHWRERQLSKLVGATWDGLRLLTTSPIRLVALVKAVRGPVPPAVEKTTWRTTAHLLRKYLRLARMRPDVVHFEWETAAGRHLPLMDVWRCPVVISCRNRGIHVFPHTPGNEDWVSRLPAVFRRTAAVHCVSEAITREATRYGLDPAKAWLIRPAVDPEFFHPSPTSSGPPAALRLISVGQLVWHKGHQYALHAIRLLVEQGVPIRFDLVGEGASRDQVLGTIEDLALRDHVRLHGRLTPAQVRGRLHDADVLLHASLSEGIPNAVLEAMACAVPVVVTDCGGIREAVTDGREGFVVPRRDSPQLAAALLALWKDPELSRRMGEAGRARVQSSFDLNDQVERTVALYEHVTGRRARVGG
jgi:colanic acid/amylovoran biosynthesis glycosyltransferase